MEYNYFNPNLPVKIPDGVCVYPVIIYENPNDCFGFSLDVFTPEDIRARTDRAFELKLMELERNGARYCATHVLGHDRSNAYYNALHNLRFTHTILWD